MSTVLNFPNIYEPVSDTTGPVDHTLDVPLRLSSKLRVVSSEGESQSRESIAIDELYRAPEVMVPELETGLRLLGEGIGFSREAILAQEDGNVIAADDSMQKLQALLPELFCCRGLGDGFGMVINAVMTALQGLGGIAASADQVLGIHNALSLVRTMPFLGTELSVEEVSKLEELGLSVDPSGFDEFISGIFDE